MSVSEVASEAGAVDESAVLVKNPQYRPTVLPDGSWVLIDESSGETVALSSSAGIFWELCTGERSIAAIVDRISELYPDADVAAIRSDICSIAPRLLELNVVAST